jgi:ribosomal protein S18 acetylase RimI-like enzyme
MCCTVPEFRIRPFRREDQVEARRIILEGMSEHFGTLDQNLNHDLDDITTTYTKAGHEFVIAELEAWMVGTGALLFEDNNRGRIVRLSVNPNFRNRGYGEAIVKHLIKLGRNNGLDQIVIETNHDWNSAIELYQKCGFQPYDRDEESLHLRIDLGIEQQIEQQLVPV